MTTATTTTSAKAWAPDIQAFAPADVIPEALILQTSTQLGNVEGDAQSVRVAWVDDADAAFVAEGVTIDESDPGLDELLIYTGKVSQLITLSREQYSQVGTAQSLAASVARAITRKANAAYIAQAAPVGPLVTPPAGLLNVASILATFDPIATDLDALADAVAAIEGNGGTPSHILTAPDAWGWLRKFKTATAENTALLGAGTNDQEKRLLGVPVITSPALPTGTLLVVDRSAIVSAVGQLVIATSEHAAFRSDAVVIRATWRFGANVVHPDRIASLTVTDPDAVV